MVVLNEKGDKILTEIPDHWTETWGPFKGIFIRHLGYLVRDMYKFNY